jgi:hypothetical protein
MAVKLPPDTYVNQVLTLKGTKDNVYSRVDGSLVGYVKDGKFIQTIDELPKVTPKKKPAVDKEFSASIKKISALNAIPALEQDAEYYKNEAEDINNSPAERAQALAKYNALQVEIAAKQKEAGQAGTVVEGIKQKSKATDARKRTEEIKGEYAKLEEQLKLILDPTSDKAGQIKNKMNKLVEEFRGAYSTVVNTPISLTAARLQIKGQTPEVAATQTTAPTAINPAVSAGFPPSTSQQPTTAGTATSTLAKDSLTKTPLPNQGGQTKPKPGTPAASVQTPVVTPGGGFTDSQNAARLAAPGGNSTGVKTPLDTLLAKTEFWYDLPDYIFKLDPKLGELLVEAVAGGWDDAKFLAKAKLTPWWQKNASTVRTRIVEREKYNDLKKAGEDVSKSDYGLYLSKQMRAVKAQAKEIAGVTLTDEQAQSIAQKIYDGFLDDDPLAINALITPFIGKVTSIAGNGLKTTGYSGQALLNYRTLQDVAKKNGFTIKDILPNVSALTAGGDLETAVLRGLADGSLDINRIAQDARALAATGQPQYVRDLLAQNYDLEDIYAPYRNTMAVTLELQPDEIDLNDPTLRMAISDKGDMNLYDFKKALRQDSRWQYTGTAKEEVSNAALGVLRDFGFQG